MDSPVSYRRFDDIDGQRDDVYNMAKSAVGEMRPLANATHQFEIADVDYDDDYNPTIADEKEAIMKRKSLQRKLMGTVRLKDTDGNVVEEQRMTLANVPHVNSRGMFIRDGVPYIVRNQLRLRPGVYTREQKNGGIESHFNIAPGTGRGFRIEMEPESGLFKMKVGQSTTRLYPVLRATGVTDDDMRKAWGDELFNKNFREKSGRDDLDLGKLVKKFGNGDVDTPKEKLSQTLLDQINRAEVDEDTSELTLGQRIKNLSPSVLLQATQKQLRIAQGLATSDNRDSQAYQSFHAAQDLIAERIRRDATGAARKNFWKAAKNGSLKNLPPGFLNDNIASLFQGSGLAGGVDDVNPVEIHDLRQAITRLGEGGMSNDSVSREARNVQGSYLGVIDSSRAPDSSNIGVDLRLTDAAERGSDNQLYTTVRNLKTGQLEKLSARTLSTKSVTFPGEMAGEGKRVPTIRGDRFVYVPKEQVEYEIANPEDMMSRAARLIPFPEGSKGQRLAMASRMTAQAVPLTDPEAPFVQTGNPDGTSLHQSMGKEMGAKFAPAEGVVTKVTPDSIEMTGNDGQRHTVQLYNHYPMSRKTYLHNEPLVKEGMLVNEGQPLARSNYTDDKGAFALGKNLRVGYMVAEGDTIEDAFVISESAAKKLGAQAMYKTDLDLDGLHATDKASYNAIYAGKYTPAQLNTIGDDGVIQVGTKVNRGDPLVLAVGKKDPAAIGALVKSPKSAVSDKAQIWDHNAPGVVTDVQRTKTGVRVLVKSYDLANVGDKLSGRHGNKGVISGHIRPDDQMPVAEDGKPLEAILNANGVVSRVNPAQLAESLLGKIVERTGRAPYVVKSFGTPEGIADFALNEAQKHGVKELETVTDPRDGRKIPNVFVGNSYLMRLHHKAEGKISARDQATYTVDDFPARGGDEGCFVANQNVVTQFGHMSIAHIVEKRLGVQVRTWSERLGEWVYRPVTDWFTYRADVADVRTIGFTGPVVSRESSSKTSLFFSYQKFSATVNHQVAMFDGSMKSVGDLTVGDRLTTWGVSPTADQMSFLLGCLLGDGSICQGGVSNGSATAPTFECEHSVKQDYYVEWKHKLLSSLNARIWDTFHAEGLIAGKKRQSVRGKQLMMYHPAVTPMLRNLCYSEDGVKRVTDEWIDRLDDRAFVIWFLDDGSMHNRIKKRGKPSPCASFATHGFSELSTDKLKMWLERRFGEAFWKGKVKDKDQWTLTASVPASWKIAALVAKYVPWNVIPKSKAWLVSYVKAAQEVEPPLAWDVTGRLAKIPMPVLTVEAYKHDKPGVTNIPVYDITVDDTHLYCANAALVSNSKRISLLDTGTLIAAGATEFLKDAKLARGQRNDDYWRQVRHGETPLLPSGSFADEQFKTMLKAAGVNIRTEGTKEHLRPLLDSDVDRMASHEVENPETFEFDTMNPIKGGLFDVGMTGGAGGNRFTKITLPVKVPHPLFLEPIQRLLGKSGKELDALLTGKDEVNGQTGPAAVEKLLGDINIDREMELAKQTIRTGTMSKRDDAVKRLHYLAGLKKMGVAPQELMVSKIAVIPPRYRPVVRGKNTDMIHDLNYLYKDLFEAKKNYEGATKTFGEAGDEYGTLMQAVRAVSGIDDPVNPKTAEQGVKGILRYAIGMGTSPKAGGYQRKVIGTSVDTVGRSVITADKHMGLDDVGVPEEMAWKIFRPYVIRRLVTNGTPPAEAIKAVEDRTPAASAFLDEEMKERPVVYNRAPALHRYAYQGAWGKRVAGDAIHMPYQTLKAIGGDFDGDAINIHVPSSAEAIDDVKEKLMPSKNLLFTGNFETHYEPTQDYTMGLYLAGKMDPTQKTVTFANAQEAKAAYARGLINARTPIRILA